MTSQTDFLRFPIGTFTLPETITPAMIGEWINEIRALPNELRKAVKDLTEDALNTPYRPGGWTVKQVIHHLADSHMNSYIRFKLAVTEENPTIRPYFEDKWAECDEAKNADIEVSLNLLESLHTRWVLFLKSLSADDWDRTFYHPESGRTSALKEVVALYAWHGKHHLHHVLIVSGNKLG